MKSLEQMKKEYAEVLVKIGVDLKDGQKLVCDCPTEHADFMPILAKAAYENGCGGFVVMWSNSAVDRINAENLLDKYECPEAKTAEYYASQGAALIRIESPDLDAMKGMSTEATSAYRKATVAMRRGFRKVAKGAGSTIACLPGKAWAKLVFPEIEDEDERMLKMWDSVLTCSRCKEDVDAVYAWKKYISDTAKRKALLDEKGYVEFKYKSDLSDFTVSPAEGSFWMGGCMETEDKVYVPNIPTEEVFQTPHKYKVNGTVAAVLPLVFGGQIIDGIKLTLKDGKIIDYSANEGYELLKNIIETDEGSHYLGEMAFIDVASPIASQGKVFYTTLYDENASCHVAIGNSYGPDDLSDEEADKLGYNHSAVHVDFMIGDGSMNIDGKTKEGVWEPIFRNGHWAI